MSNKIRAELRWVLPDGQRVRCTEVELPPMERSCHVRIKRAMKPFHETFTFLNTDIRYGVAGEEKYVFECDIIDVLREDRIVPQ